MKERMRNIFFRIWYWYISAVDREAEVIFMNYGFSKENYSLILPKHHEKDRYSIQLYDFVASGTEINGKDILEIGCGRGGGLSYINMTYKPNSATGIDLNPKAINFCNSYYKDENISFQQGDAQSLDFQDECFDVVINVESSHRYVEIDNFIQEVNRVLKPGGIFLFADFRHKAKLKELNAHFDKTNFQPVHNESITSHVLKALQLSTEDRINLIKKIAPFFLHGLGKKFAATEGTPTYMKFFTEEWVYFFMILRKDN
jgi:ubiquinone/menaquinone biosynthesis C-methylase UbiE